MKYTFLEIRENNNQEIAYVLDNDRGVVMKFPVENNVFGGIIKGEVVPQAFAPAQQKSLAKKKKYVMPKNVSDVFQTPPIQ